MPGTVPGSPVFEYYNDAKVFITGGTGFLGKALVEKFLRVFPNIDHLYLLIRMKKGKDPQSRMKELFSDPLFNTLRIEKPDFEKNVTCIPGDVNGPRLTMSDNDYEFLTSEVTHVFHSAATVRFNENLDTAIGINIRGTKEMLDFANKCTRLKVFVHISTAYSQFITTEVREDFYDPPITPEKAISLIDTLGAEKLRSITSELIKPWPNTYSFTKAVAENIVLTKGKSIPAIIFRPAIVMGSFNEPTRGWVDNIYGPTGVIVAVGVGLLRVLHANSNLLANIIPVDLTVNALISCGWEGGTTFSKQFKAQNSLDSLKEDSESSKKTEIIPKVYNFVADSNNSMTWGEFISKNLKEGVKVPSEKTIWYYTLTITRIRLIYLSLIFFLHYVPAVLADGVLMIIGKKPQMIKAYQKLHTFSGVMAVFSNRYWEFRDNNIKKLFSRLSDADKELFNFDMAKLNWDDYIPGLIIGIRNFIFKETDQNLSTARRKMFFLWLVHRLVQFSFITLFLWILGNFLFSIFGWKSHVTNPVVVPTDFFRNST